MPNVVKGSKQERMRVVPHRPWRAVWLTSAVCVLVVLFVLGGAFAGYTQGEALQAKQQRQWDELEGAVSSLQQENEDLRRALALAKRQAEVDQNAAQEVAGDLSGLQARIAQLEGDLAYYRLVVEEQTGSTGLTISSFDLRPAGRDNARRYKLVLRQQDADGDTYLEGYVQVTLIGERNGQRVRMPLKDVSAEQEEEAIRLRFKYFQNVEGEIVVPEGFEPVKLEVRAVADSPVAKRVDQELAWDY
mgnify:FL=1